MSDQILNAAVESLIGGTSGQIVVCQGAGALVSTSALKTVGGTSLLGSGNIAVGSGDVVGPSSSTDNAIARFDATTGKLLQNCVVTIGDTGNIAGLGTVSCGTITATGLTTTSGIATIGNSTSGVRLGGVTGSGDSIEVALNSSIPRMSAVVGGAYVGEFGMSVSNSYLQSATGLIRLRGTSIACRNNGNSADAPLTAEAITASGLMCAGVYTFATVPSASSNTGKFLRISDRAQKHAYSDGTNWRFFGDDAIIS